ncbi:MAG: hypothetical protein EAX95_11970 [Candidatus Thorarchaeota archaeon]|nr:hypothetical protein [Candidatus Thorarchaeota archaeon]
MQAKPIFLLTTIVGLFFGISLLLVPEFILDLVEVTYLNGGPVMARHTGSWVLAGALFAFLIRNEEHSGFRQAVFIFFDISFVLMMIVELYGYFMALGGVMLWAIIAIHALFVILYTYLFIKNR